MLFKFSIGKDKIFILALAASLLWHIFWLSAVTITAPKEAGVLRFSKVSFLGPLPGRFRAEARFVPRERSFLERRYITHVYGISGANGAPADIRESYKSGKAYDGKLLGFLEETLSGSKLEPPAASD